MSVIFRIRPAGQLDGVTVPLIQTVVQDPDSGIYDVTFNSLNNNFGVLDIQELLRVGLGNTADDFLVPQLILTDGAATTLTLSKDAYSPGGPQAGVNRELLWEYIGAPEDIIGPKAFLNFTGQRLIVNSDNASPGESEIYVVAYPVSSKELLDAICCTQEGDNAAPPAASCCAPQYLSQNQFGAYAELYTTGTIFSVDLDASVCGQPPGSPGVLGASIRPSFFAASGTPPFVVIAEHDPVNNIARVTIDAQAADDGSYVLELTNDCGCCALIPLIGGGA